MQLKNQSNDSDLIFISITFDSLVNQASGPKRMEVLEVASVELDDAIKTLQLFLQHQTDGEDSNVTVRTIRIYYFSSIV